MEIGTLLQGLLDNAAKNPVLLISLLLGVGSLLGAIRIKRIGLGAAAILFLAIGLSAANPALVLPPIIGSIGLALFAYTIGINAGPSFFASLRKGSKIIGFTVFALVVVGGLAMALGHLLGLSSPVMAGIYAGALTNTPALAAASEQVGGEGPIVGYSLTYLYGVIGMLIVTTIAAGKAANAKSERKNLVARNVRIEKAHLPDLETLAATYGNQLVFSRIMRGDTPEHEGTVEIATDSTVPRVGDIITVVGEPADVERAVSELGHPSTVALQLDRRYLDFRRITMSNTKLSGQHIGDLDLERKFGATITRVRRGDADLLATDDLAVLTGDRLRVVAPRDRLSGLSDYLGDSETSTSTLNAASLGIGISLGVLLGLIIWPIPGGTTFALGVAGGSLVVGLLLGRAMRTGPFVWTLPYGTSNTLGQLGLLLFLAYAGSTAGPAFLKAFQSDELPYILIAGFIITTVFFTALLLFGKYVAKQTSPALAGTIAGAATQPAGLAHANALVNSPNVNLGYALVYPAAMIVKVIVAPLVATLF